jgi:hypothetical protein
MRAPVGRPCVKLTFLWALTREYWLRMHGVEIKSGPVSSNTTMLANLLIVLGLAALGAGLFLKWKSPEPSPMSEGMSAPPAEEPSAVVNPNEGYEKGLAFEKWVADRFKRDVYKVKHWRSDKRSNDGVYADSNSDPDLLVDFIMGQIHQRLAVECKWRASFQSGTIELAKEHQIQNYRTYAAREKCKVFILLGVGGTPSAPADLYVIPVEQTRNGSVSYAEVLPFKQRMSMSTFYYDTHTGVLKL